MSLSRLGQVTLRLVGISGWLASAGCVFRDEVITVEPDGGVTIALEIEADEGELDAGDAMPSEATGWNVARSVKKEKDKTKHLLSTTRRFAPGEALPDSFAPADDPDADLYLKSPTTVRFERRADGVYYYFHRVYAARRWAYVRYWQDKAFDDRLKKLSEKPIEEMTAEERLQIIGAFVSFEALKQAEFTRIAMEESHPHLPVEHSLIARRALLEVYESGKEQLGAVIDRCAGLPKVEEDQCFDAEADRLLADGHHTFVASLQQSAGLTDRQIVAFELAYAQAQRLYELTDQLGGHGFEIDVVMPGTIIGHNSLDGDVEVNREANTSAVTFKFEGDIFRDRPHELIVVSRLSHDEFNQYKRRGHGRN